VQGAVTSLSSHARRRKNILHNRWNKGTVRASVIVERAMRRIVITHSAGVWSFERNGQEPVYASSPLNAAIAARDYGETFRGQALGYIIRLDHAGATGSDQWITLHTEVF